MSMPTIKSTTSFGMDTTDVTDRIVVMCRQEDTTYKCIDYLHYLKSTYDENINSSKVVNEDCRLKMLQWCLQVADFCKFDNETVCIGMSFLDRYLSTQQGQLCLFDRKEFQLASVCAFFIAVKLNEQRELDIALLSEISNGAYTTARIALMEGEMLSALNWRMSAPTALTFIQHLIALIPESAMQPSVRDGFVNFARRQTELAVMDYYFVTCKSSMIAVASIMNTIEGLDFRHLSRSNRRSFINEMMRITAIDVKSNEMAEVRQRLKDAMSPATPATAQKTRNKRARSPVTVCGEA